MSVVTAIKYDVLEHILKEWLEGEFGNQAWCEVSVSSHADFLICFGRGGLY